MAYFEQFKQLDGTTLFNSTITATGPQTVIDTQYYGSVSIQIGESGGSLASILSQVEGSNDLSNWDPLLLHTTSDLSLTDTINSIDDTYTVKTSARYLRLNVARFTGTPTVIMVGRSGAGPSAADNLAAAFNPDTPLQVNIGLNKDSNGGLLLSDGIVYSLPTQAGATIVIDTTGYQSFIFQGVGGTNWTTSQSIDGVVYISSPVAQLVSGIFSGVATSAPNNSNAVYYGVIQGRYLRVVSNGTTNGAVSKIILKQGPSPAASLITGTMINGINGVQAVTGGLNGTLAVGGAAAIAVAPTTNPLTVGGSDLTGLTRRLLTDVSGRTFFNALSPYFNSLANNTSTVISSSNSPGANTALPINTVGSIPASYQQSAALNVQDTSQYEGQNFTELLAQILLEMRIMNQQLYELPRLIATNQASSDPPETFRQEPSIFNQ